VENEKNIIIHQNILLLLLFLSLLINGPKHIQFRPNMYIGIIYILNMLNIDIKIDLSQILNAHILNIK